MFVVRSGGDVIDAGNEATEMESEIRRFSREVVGYAQMIVADPVKPPAAGRAAGSASGR